MLRKYCNKYSQLIIIFFFGGHSIVFGQQLFIQRYSAEVYNGGQNYQIVQDKQGVIYVANSDGILRYDGAEWGLITLPKKEGVFSLAIDPLGKIYTGGYGDFGYLDKDNAGNYKYHSLLPQLPSKYGNVTNVFQTVMVSNVVFFCDTKHIYVFENEKIRVLNFKVSPLQPLYSLKNHLYLLSHDSLYVYRNTNFELADFPENFGVSIKKIANYAQNNYLILDHKDKLWVFDPRATTVKKKLSLLTDRLISYVKGASIFDLKFLDNDVIAIFAEGQIVFIKPNGELIYHIDPDILRYLSYTSSFLDEKHNLWIASTKEILQIITSSPLSYFDEHNGINHKIISLGESGDFQYVGTGWGIYYKEKKATRFSVLPQADGEAWNFYNFHQKLYTAHRTGVLEIQGKRVTALIDHQYVLSLCELRNQPERMIFGTFNTGIWLMKKSKNKWHKKKIKGFEEETRFMQEDGEGNIWISHYNKGLFKLRLNEKMDSVVNTTFYDSRNGLPSDLNNRIYSLQNREEIIVATANGFYFFNSKKNRFEPEDKFNKALGNGFCIYTLAETSKGDIYFSGGVSNVKETAGLLKKQADGTFKLVLTPFNKIAIRARDLRIDIEAPVFISENETVWIGNDQKLINFNPTQKTFYNEPIYVSIKQVWSKDSLIYLSDRKQSINDLPFSQNNLRFDFVCFLYENPEKVEYQFKLKPFDTQWSTWTPTKEATFTNLPHGNYTFQVRAKDQYNAISQPVSFSFHISPPWYKTPWAYFLYVVSLVLITGLIIALYTWRIRRRQFALQMKVNEQTKELLAMNAELSVKSDEVHNINLEICKQAKELEKSNSTKDKLFSIISHDLRGPIRQVQEILNLIDLNYISEVELKKIVPDLKENIANTLRLTDDLLFWAKTQMDGIQVQPAFFDIRNIVDENVMLFKSFAQCKKIHLSNFVDVSLVVYADSNMILLVLRNLINNGIKFTNSGGSVVIGYESHHDYAILFVEDTGVGLSKEEICKIFNKEHFTKYGTSGEKGTGLGLMLCQEFVEKNGGTITVESELGIGSRFSFRIPKWQI